MWYLAAVVIIACSGKAEATAEVAAAAASSVFHNVASQQQQSPAALPPPLYGWAPGDPGFTVQTGYEGYLVPSTGTGPSLMSGWPLGALGAVGTGAHLLHSLIPHPKLALKVVAKIGLWLSGIVLFLLMGSLFTTAICAFTPICTISFLGFGLNRETMRSYLSAEKLSSAAAFVDRAVEKYRLLQNKSSSPSSFRSRHHGKDQTIVASDSTN